MHLSTYRISYASGHPKLVHAEDVAWGGAPPSTLIKIADLASTYTNQGR